MIYKTEVYNTKSTLSNLMNDSIEFIFSPLRIVFADEKDIVEANKNKKCE